MARVEYAPQKISTVRGPAVTAAVLLIWTVLAVRRPELTYHFSPLIAAAAWPIATRREHAVPLRTAAAVAAMSFAAVSIYSVGLAVGNFLEGPTFFDAGPALAEAVIFSAFGAAWGARVASRASAGFLGRIFS